MCLQCFDHPRYSTILFRLKWCFETKRSSWYFGVPLISFVGEINQHRALRRYDILIPNILVCTANVLSISVIDFSAPIPISSRRNFVGKNRLKSYCFSITTLDWTKIKSIKKLIHSSRNKKTCANKSVVVILAKTVPTKKKRQKKFLSLVNAKHAKQKKTKTRDNWRKQKHIFYCNFHCSGLLGVWSEMGVKGSTNNTRVTRAKPCLWSRPNAIDDPMDNRSLRLLPFDVFTSVQNSRQKQGLNLESREFHHFD